jgi:UDP-N-acetylglucosamine diphosphorylase/glucosamine-1-phosphate N-acetyltransferase
MTDFITFDDGQGTFGPLTDLRPAVHLRTGAVLTEQRQGRRLGGRAVAVWTTSELAEVVAEQADIPVNAFPAGDAHLCVNGRWSALDDLSVPDLGTALIDADSGTVIMAHLDAAAARSLCEQGELPAEVDRIDAKATMYSTPWDVLDQLERALLDDIASCGVPAMAADQMHVHGTHQVLLHPDATILPGVVADTTAGPVVVHAGAVVRSNASLCGPCVIGPGSIVTDGALIKSCTSIGPHCRVGGEVGGSILQGYSNKSHEGHLGDSILGRWVNLGAGTVNSNLLNTYTEVLIRLAPDARMSRTGRIFMGSIIGDHVKTAIGTRLMTGTVLGTGCMVASSTPPSTSLPPFTWLTDSGASQYRSDKFLDVARAVMARRGMEPGPAETAALRRLCDAAAGRRTD